MTMEFKKLAESIHGNDTLMNSISEKDRFDLIGLYHQATKGDHDAGHQPGIPELKVKGTYDAWKSKKGMSKEAAEKAYLDIVKRVAPETIFPV